MITSASLILKGSHAEPLGSVGSTADCQQPKIIGLRGVSQIMQAAPSGGASILLRLGSQTVGLRKDAVWIHQVRVAAPSPANGHPYLKAKVWWRGGRATVVATHHWSSFRWLSRGHHGPSS